MTKRHVATGERTAEIAPDGQSGKRVWWLQEAVSLLEAFEQFELNINEERGM